MTQWVRDTEVWCKYKPCVNYNKKAKRHCRGACFMADYEYNQLKKEISRKRNSMHWRKIEVDGVLHKYYVGQGNAVIENTVTGKKQIVGLDKITGMSWDTIERAQDKRYFSVLPKQIASYIRASF